MLKEYRLITGNHGFEKLCSGCAKQNSVVRGNMSQTVHLTLVSETDKETGKVSPIFYCRSCSDLVSREIGQEASTDSSVLSRNEEEQSRTNWAKIWNEIQREREMGASDRKRREMERK